MLRFRFVLAPMVRLIQRLRGESHRVGAARAAAEHLRLTTEVFAAQGRPIAAWPLKAVPINTPRGPARRSDPTPRLQDTGRLLGSIQFRVTDRGYEIGPEGVPYAAIHQTGGEIAMSGAMRRVLQGLGFRPRRTTLTVRIPARPYLGLPDQWVPIITEAYASALLEDAAGAAGTGG